MRNRYLEKIDNIVEIKIVGSNINSYLRRIIKKKINIIKVTPISRKEVHLVLKYSEYLRLLEINSIYEVSIIKYRGRLKFKEQIKNNYILLMFMVLGLIGIVVLSNIIFFVEVIHQDKEIRSFLKSELASYGIVKYSFKKDYNQLEKIEDEILEKNKDRLEWIEIITYGTKYMVRVEERKLNKKEDEVGEQSIVSKKNAVLVRIDAVSGEKVKNVNDYVEKGEVVISGYITLPDNSKVMTRAMGVVYGEVWYQVDVDFPIVYQETKLTGKSKDIFVVEFFNKRISLFDYDKYHSFKSRNKVLLESNLLGVKFVREKQYEAVIKDEIYTEDMARGKAIDYIKNKLTRDNKNIIKIDDIKILSMNSDEDSIEFKLFIKTIEDIGEAVAIKEVLIEEETNTS